MEGLVFDKNLVLAKIYLLIELIMEFFKSLSPVYFRLQEKKLLNSFDWEIPASRVQLIEDNAEYASGNSFRRLPQRKSFTNSDRTVLNYCIRLISVLNIFIL